MRPGLFLAVRPLPALDNGDGLAHVRPSDAPPSCHALREALTVAFPHSSDYVTALCPADRSVSPQASVHRSPACSSAVACRYAYQRLAALALLPRLIRVADGDPAALILRRDGHGRPYASLPDGTIPFDFNITHTARHIACALLVPTDAGGTAGQGSGHSHPPPPPRVGLDIEEPIPLERAARLAARFCTEGERRLLETVDFGQKSRFHRDAEPWQNRAKPWPDRDLFSPENGFLPPISDFTRLWTIREALAKQDGRGGPLGFDAATPPPHVILISARLPDTDASLTLCLPAACVSELGALRLL